MDNHEIELLKNIQKKIKNNFLKLNNLKTECNLDIDNLILIYTYILEYSVDEYRVGEKGSSESDESEIINDLKKYKSKLKIIELCYIFIKDQFKCLENFMYFLKNYIIINEFFNNINLNELIELYKYIPIPEAKLYEKKDETYNTTSSIYFFKANTQQIHRNKVSEKDTLIFYIYFFDKCNKHLVESYDISNEKYIFKSVPGNIHIVNELMGAINTINNTEYKNELMGTINTINNTEYKNEKLKEILNAKQQKEVTSTKSRFFRFFKGGGQKYERTNKKVKVQYKNKIYIRNIHLKNKVQYCKINKKYILLKKLKNMI